MSEPGPKPNSQILEPLGTSVSCLFCVQTPKDPCHHPTPHQDKTLTMATGVLQPRAPNLKVAFNWRAIRHPSGSSGKGSACRVVVWTESRVPTMTPIRTTVLPLPNALLAVISCVLIARWGEISLLPFYTQGNRLRVVYTALSVLVLPM